MARHQPQQRGQAVFSALRQRGQAYSGSMESGIRHLRLATGIHVPCVVHGDADAPPLLLLHAWGESSGCFDRLVPCLPDFRIYAPDLRGQGNADKPLKGYSLKEQAGDAAAILDGLEVSKAFVLGSSSGGYVAQQLAADSPGRVAALILVGTPVSLHGRSEFAEEIHQLSDPVTEEWVRNFLAGFPFAPTVPGWFFDDRVREGLAMPAHAWKAIFDGLCAAEPPTESGTIVAPTLVLWGAQDGVSSQEEQETLAGRIAGAKLKVYPDAGHLVLWEYPERVAQDTVAFLGRLH